MSNSRKTFSMAVAVIVALTVTPMLSGCVNPFAGGNPVRDAIKNATGGKLDVGGTSVPDDFPKEVPIASGKVLFAGAIDTEDGRVWNLTIQASGIADFDGIVSQFEGAGFKSETMGIESESTKTAILSKDNLGVLLVVSKDSKDNWVANYTVTKKKSGS
ncbi:MAG: hypothetical protein KF844_02910 [Cryobacterium sp.]|nr:hypothetical protein [Cryobacterium sp.]